MIRLFRKVNRICYELFYKYKLRKKSIFINKGVLFSETEFEGKNSVETNSDVSGSKIGYGSYVGKDCVLNKCEIGRFCSIANGIKVLKNNHPLDFFSTHPAFHRPKSKLMQKLDFVKLKSDKIDDFNYIVDDFHVIIGSDVWIGEDVKIISGVKIGDGAVIAAGSVVTKNVEGYSIVGGIPAKHLRFRFNEEFISKIKQLNLWGLEPIEIESYTDLMEYPELLVKRLDENN